MISSEEGLLTSLATETDATGRATAYVGTGFRGATNSGHMFLLVARDTPALVRILTEMGFEQSDIDIEHCKPCKVVRP